MDANQRRGAEDCLALQGVPAPYSDEELQRVVDYYRTLFDRTVEAGSLRKSLREIAHEIIMFRESAQYPELTSQNILWVSTGRDVEMETERGTDLFRNAGAAIRNEVGTYYISVDDLDRLLASWDGTSHVRHHFKDVSTQTYRRILTPYYLMGELRDRVQTIKALGEFVDELN